MQGFIQEPKVQEGTVKRLALGKLEDWNPTEKGFKNIYRKNLKIVDNL